MFWLGIRVLWLAFLSACLFGLLLTAVDSVFKWEQWFENQIDFFKEQKLKGKKKSLMCSGTVASVSGCLLLPHLCAANFQFVLCSFALGFLLAFLCWLSFAHLIVLCVFFSNCIYVLAACLSRFCFWRLLNWKLYKLFSHPDHLFNQICSATNMTAVEVICHFFLYMVKGRSAGEDLHCAFQMYLFIHNLVKPEPSNKCQKIQFFRI